MKTQPSPTFWHGGPTILGDMLLPPSQTGRARVCHGDEWVYLTPTRHLAKMYAGTSRGWLYEVEALDDVEQDPDSMLPPGESVRCHQALIRRRFRLSRRECDEICDVVGSIEDVL